MPRRCKPTLHHEGTSLFSAACKPMSGVAAGILGAAQHNFADVAEGPGSVGGGVAVNPSPTASSDAAPVNTPPPVHAHLQSSTSSSSFPPAEQVTSPGTYDSTTSPRVSLEGVPMDAPPEYSEFVEETASPVPVVDKRADGRPVGW